jgi:hypothetical protein
MTGVASPFGCPGDRGAGLRESVSRQALGRHRAHLPAKWRPAPSVIQTLFQPLRISVRSSLTGETRSAWRTIDEAKLAAIKLRLWTGEKGIYSKLFDSPTTIRPNSNCLFFDIEGRSRTRHWGLSRRRTVPFARQRVALRHKPRR